MKKIVFMFIFSVIVLISKGNAKDQIASLGEYTCGPNTINGIGEAQLKYYEGKMFVIDYYSIGNKKLCEPTQSNKLGYPLPFSSKIAEFSLKSTFVFQAAVFIIEDNQLVDFEPICGISYEDFTPDEIESVKRNDYRE